MTQDNQILSKHTLSKPPPDNRSGGTTITHELRKYEITKPIPLEGRALHTVSDNSTVDCSFNVMPGKFVQERLLIREYRVWEGYAETTFDRQYSSAMLNSPSHLVLLSLLAHSQKLAYIWTTLHMGLGYDPDGPEKCKFWWSTINCHLPKLVPEEIGIIQSLSITRFRRVDDKKWTFHAVTKVGDAIRIELASPVYFV
jgi:hypothetical protein